MLASARATVFRSRFMRVSAGGIVGASFGLVSSTNTPGLLCQCGPSVELTVSCWCIELFRVKFKCFRNVNVARSAFQLFHLCKCDGIHASTGNYQPSFEHRCHRRSAVQFQEFRQQRCKSSTPGINMAGSIPFELSCDACDICTGFCVVNVNARPITNCCGICFPTFRTAQVHCSARISRILE